MIDSWWLSATSPHQRFIPHTIQGKNPTRKWPIYIEIGVGGKPGAEKAIDRRPSLKFE
jgi:DNA polymerase IIIc chi subunit